MKFCDYCNEANSEDSMYCKKCGRPLYEEIEEQKKQEKVKKEKTKKTKKVKKTKPKKKVIHETKVIDQREKGRMSFFQKFMMFFLFLLCMVSIGAVAVLGYHIYQTENITVPDVTGLTYEEAEIRLQDVGLNATRIEVVTEDESEVGIVLKQKKRGGAKASENAMIELSVGVLDTTVEVPDVEGKTLEEAKQIALKHANLNENNVTLVKAEIEHDGEGMYEIEWRDATYEYEFDISRTGNVLHYDKDRIHD